MIGKIIPAPTHASKRTNAQNIKNLCEYILDARARVGAGDEEGEPEKILFSGGMNFSFDDPKARISEMSASAASHARAKAPWAHVIFSLREGESFGDSERVEKIVKDALAGLGLKGHRAVYGVHANTQNQHIHLCVDRADPATGKLVKINQGFDKIAVQKVTAEIAQKYGFSQEKNMLFLPDASGKLVENPHRQRGLSDAARAAESRTGTESLERRARALAPEIAAATTWADLHTRRREHGARYYKRRGGAVVAFGKEGNVKASKIDRAASLAALEKRLGTFEPAPQKIYQAPALRLRRNVTEEEMLLALLLSAYGMHAQAREVLFTRQSIERREIFEQRQLKFQARRALLSVQRAEHRAERQALRTEQKAEISDLKQLPGEQISALFSEKFSEKNTEKILQSDQVLENNIPAGEAPATAEKIRHGAEAGPCREDAPGCPFRPTDGGDPAPSAEESRGVERRVRRNRMRQSM